MKYEVRDLIVVAPHKCNYSTTCGGGKTYTITPPTKACNKPDAMVEEDLLRLREALAAEE